MGLQRRDVLLIAGGSAAGVATGAVAGFVGNELLSGRRRDVAGFEWTDDFAPLPNEELPGPSPRYDGDPSARFLLRYDTSPMVAIVGAPNADVTQALAVRGMRLGLAYTDPEGTWRQGYGRPGQLFGGVVGGKFGPFVTAALGIGPGDVEFSWVVRDEEGQVTQLPTTAISQGGVPREEAARAFPGVPHL